MAIFKIEYEAKHRCGLLTDETLLVNEEEEECEICDVIDEMIHDCEQIIVRRQTKTGWKPYYRRFVA